LKVLIQINFHKLMIISRNTDHTDMCSSRSNLLCILRCDVHLFRYFRSEAVMLLSVVIYIFDVVQQTFLKNSL